MTDKITIFNNENPLKLAFQKVSNIHIKPSYMNTSSKVPNIPIWKNKSLNNLPNEKWEYIPKLNNYYQVSSLGRVKCMERIIINSNGVMSKYKSKILTQSLNTDGYPRLSINYKQKLKQYSLHRLVSKAFIPNPLKKTHVNHKNGIKTDNRVENLEWVTHGENVKHSYDKLGRKRKTKKTMQFDLQGNLIREYNSAKEAAQITGINHNSLTQACSGTYETSGGFKWKYKTEKKQ